MTIAIGADYREGIIICADSKVVASDGATTSEMKVQVALGPPRYAIAVANAAEDGHAATMLAESISLAAAHPDADPDKDIKPLMTAWHNAYGEQPAPHLQFIIGDGAHKAIYLCEPPATVLECCPVAIGRGARAVEPYMGIPDGLVPHSASMRATLLRLAFLMYRAKKDEGSACGGETHVIVLPQKGGFFIISKREMAEAENLAAEIDSLMFQAARTVTAELPPDEVMRRYQAIIDRAAQFKFPSLRDLEKFMVIDSRDDKSPG